MYKTTNACNLAASINEDHVIPFCVFVLQLCFAKSNDETVYLFYVDPVILPDAELCRYPVLAIACLFPLQHLLQRNVARHVAWSRLAYFFLVVSVSLLPYVLQTPNCFSTPTKGWWFMMIQSWFNDDYMISVKSRMGHLGQMHPNASCLVSKHNTTWISGLPLAVGPWGLSAPDYLTISGSVWAEVPSMQKVNVWMSMPSWSAQNAWPTMFSATDLKRLASNQLASLQNGHLEAIVWKFESPSNLKQRPCILWMQREVQEHVCKLTGLAIFHKWRFHAVCGYISVRCHRYHLMLTAYVVGQRLLAFVWFFVPSAAVSFSNKVHSHSGGALVFFQKGSLWGGEFGARIFLKHWYLQCFPAIKALKSKTVILYQTSFHHDATRFTRLKNTGIYSG